MNNGNKMVEQDQEFCKSEKSVLKRTKSDKLFANAFR